MKRVHFIGERGGVSPPVIARADKNRGADAAPLACRPNHSASLTWFGAFFQRNFLAKSATEYVSREDSVCTT